MGVIVVYLDTILVPLSLLLTIGYHAYLWHTLRYKPFMTTIGMNMMKRRTWFEQLNQQENDKKGMLAVQSLRNTLMASILTATVTIIIILALAALFNNAFNANHLLSGPVFGSQSGRITVLKYGAACLFLSASFLCSSMAVGCLVDANFLMNALGEFSTSPTYTQTILERGFTLAVVGNRVLCITFPFLLWMFGPVAVFFSSAALVFGLYGLDFSGNYIK